MSTITEVKGKLNVQTLGLNRVVAENGEKTPWYKNWDNDNRVAILVHEDTLAAIKADNTLNTLGINVQTKQGKQGEYIAKTICIYKETEETL
jgi:hypothetical protein